MVRRIAYNNAKYEKEMLNKHKFIMLCSVVLFSRNSDFARFKGFCACCLL